MSDATQPSKLPRTWYFFGSLGFALLAYLAFYCGAWLISIAVFMADMCLSPIAWDSSSHQAYWHAWTVLGGTPFAIGVIWLAVRRARREFVDYLALIWPRADELVLALIGTFIAFHLISAFGGLLGAPADTGSLVEYQGARNDGSLFFYLVIACIVGPIVEEIVVRGFLFRGWSESSVGPMGAIVLSSALWGFSHFQYDLYGRFEIFLIGVVFCYFRYRSGSTLLTIVLHSAVNFYIMIWFAAI